jgi:3-dehydroquinate dehydratase-1
MICVSLEEKNLEELIQILQKVEFAEIRLDSMTIDISSVWNIFSQHSNLIATCRPGYQNNVSRKIQLLAAIEAGAAYVDIEVESENDFKRALIPEAQRQGCKVIISYHNFERTPDRPELEQIVTRCFDSGADIAKIACQIRSVKDNARILGILTDSRPLVVIGMGQIGKITRIVGPYLGSQFTYASLAEGRETAEGQINITQLSAILKKLANV